MVVGFFSCKAAVSLPLEKFRYEILSLIGDMLPHWILETVLSFEYIVDNLFIRFAAKRWLSTHHNEKDHAHGPIVTLGCVTSPEHLRSNVVWSPIRCSHNLIRIDTLGEAEVNEFHVGIIVLFEQKEILWLDVSNVQLQNEIKIWILWPICPDITLINLPVADFIVMQIAQGVEGLAHYECGLRFCQMFPLRDKEEKFTSFT